MFLLQYDWNFLAQAKTIHLGGGQCSFKDPSKVVSVLHIYAKPKSQVILTEGFKTKFLD